MTITSNLTELRLWHPSDWRPRRCVCSTLCQWIGYTVCPKKYAHGFVVLCFVVVMQSSIMNSHEVFIHIHQGCFAGTGAIVRLPQCQWSKLDGYGKISQRITTTNTAKQKPCAYILGYTVVARNLSLWRHFSFEFINGDRMRPSRGSLWCCIRGIWLKGIKASVY